MSPNKIIQRFERAVRANGYRIASDSAENEYEAAKAELVAALSSAPQIGTLRKLVDLVAEDTGALSMLDPDEDSVGWDGDGNPLTMTFGHVRRAVKELQAIDRDRQEREPLTPTTP